MKVETLEIVEELGTLTIGELYEKYNSGKCLYTQNGHEMLDVNDLNILTTDGNNQWLPYYGKAKRLIRHRVTKGKWSVMVGTKEVIMTADHGNVVLRGTELVRVRPVDILDDDILVWYDSGNCRMQKVGKVTYLGDFDDEYVYDIEMVNDPHVFFANDILVHNSLYINTAPIVDTLIGVNGDPSDYEHVQKICKEIDDKLVTGLNNNLKLLAKKEFNSDNCTLKFARETYCSSGTFCAKKAYVLRRLNDGKKDKNGKYIVKEKFKYTGVEVKKSSIPEIIKDDLRHIIENNLREFWNSTRYNEEVIKVWDKFRQLGPDDIALWKGYNTEKEMEGFLQAGKGTGGTAKACLIFNQLVDHFNLGGKYKKIATGEKVRYCAIMKNNPYGLDVIAWNTDEFPEEFKSIFHIDYVTMFEKVFLNALDNFEKANNWVPANPTKQIATSIEDL